MPNKVSCRHEITVLMCEPEKPYISGNDFRAGAKAIRYCVNIAFVSLRWGRLMRGCNFSLCVIYVEKKLFSVVPNNGSF